MPHTPEQLYIVPQAQHDELVRSVYRHRGFSEEEAEAGARSASDASYHGVRSHNAIKALHLDQLFGSGSEGCVPNAQIEKIPSRFASAQVWNAHRKLGQAVAQEAIEACIEMAEQTGIGIVSVDNAFHYLWGGGYVMNAAKRGYIAYTNCTAAMAEVLPYLGKYPTLGTNPHSWGFPTTEAVGFPVVIDWATSVVSKGRVQQFAREGIPLPGNAAVDEKGQPTSDATRAKYLLPFAEHKGYGLSLVNELLAAMIGGGIPTARSRWISDDEKHTPCFFFQVIHPDAVNANMFAQGRSQKENIKAVLRDILGHGNEGCSLPGQHRAAAAELSKACGGLLFSEMEIHAFNELAEESRQDKWDLEKLKKTTVG